MPPTMVACVLVVYTIQQQVPSLSFLVLNFYVLDVLNHRMVDVGRHFWRSPGSNSLLKQSYLEPVAQDLV